MRIAAVLALVTVSLTGCQQRLSRIDPVLVCDSVSNHTDWRPIGVGASLTVSVPWSLQHPEQFDQLGPVPKSQQWYSRDLSVEWDMKPRSADGSVDSLRPLPSRPDSTAASPACSAPAPEGWVTLTYIWQDRRTRVLAIYSISRAPSRQVYGLYIVARTDSTFRDALAIAKSLRIAGGP